MIKKLFETDNSIAQLIIRVTLAVVFFPHGAQKVLGWWGGAGFTQTVEVFTEKFGAPFFIPYTLMSIEFLGSMALLIGLLTRPAALGIAGAMAVCAFMNHLQNGFFMNWFGKQAGEGFEFHLLAIGMAIALIIKGGGMLSLDRLIAKKKG